MSAGLAPLGFVIPGSQGIQSAKPVRGATLMGIADALNHFAGVRGIGWHPCGCYSAPDATGGDYDIGDILDTGARSEVIRIYLRTSPLTAHLALSLVVASYNGDGGPYAPEITAALDTPLGVSIDIGCKWTRAHGTLPGQPWTRFDADSADATTDWHRYVRPSFIESGSMARDDEANDASAAEAPRLLYLGAYSGTDVILTVTTQAVYTVSVTAFEYPEGVIDHAS